MSILCTCVHRESLTATKHQLLTCEEELSATNDKLTQMEQKCNQLEAFLTSESRYYTVHVPTYFFQLVNKLCILQVVGPCLFSRKSVHI